MLRNFLKNRKAQNTAEYALLIALVVAGVIAMQTYAQRALQARIHDAAQYMANTDSNSQVGLGNSTQYEPYYLNSEYNVETQSTENKRLAPGFVGADSNSNRARGGQTTSTYNAQNMNQTL
jgi:Flp pilus assembly pilin Flp